MIASFDGIHSKRVKSGTYYGFSRDGGSLIGKETEKLSFGAEEIEGSKRKWVILEIKNNHGSVSTISVKYKGTKSVSTGTQQAVDERT